MTKKPNIKKTFDIVRLYEHRFSVTLPELRKAMAKTSLKKFWDRSNWNGHFTATAFLVHDDKVLKIRHKTLNKTLYPGGHCEPYELPTETAKRELFEETGLKANLHQLHNNTSLCPLRIDSHIIPANALKNEPEHYHHDFTYAFLPETSPEKITLSADEAISYKWEPLSKNVILQRFISTIVQNM